MLGLEGSIRQTFERLVLHTPHGTVRFPLPWTFSTFDYPALCELLDAQNDAEFETATVEGRGRRGAGARERQDRPRRGVRAARRGRARAGAGCSARTATSRPTPRSRAGSRCIPGGSQRRARDLDRPLDRAGRLRLELPGRRRGAGRRRLVRPALPRQGADGRPRRAAASATPSATRATGSRTGCAPRPSGDVFFAGDSAGHCLPLTAEGIRTAFYFGIALGRELRQVIEGRASRETRAAPLRGVLRRARVEVPVDAARAAPRAARAAARCSRSRRRAMATRASRTGRSTTTSKIAHPELRARAGRRREPAARSLRSPPERLPAPSTRGPLPRRARSWPNSTEGGST